ncbi:serine hydrolase domain-containing protein [Planctomonas psychrotolerans]|uniref:serine hydrolase domain-containing protein n=1 Tax=Planctomonas psychrotolerans TaxID=2528712 RepID=UPI00123B56EA|nr:serine hydrolase domain-containing protein [Planctomonas psychrotolerans]
MLTPLTGPLQGGADDRLGDTVARFEAALRNDPDYSFQAAAYADGECVLDVWGGPHLRGDSVMVPFSVTKNTIGFSIALLIDRGELDLDERVAHYWPEFAALGKQHVTVRMLLSHQAGLPQAEPPLSWDELLDHHAAAERLAGTRPFWYPGSAFGYHAITIGNLASELVFRVTGRTLHDFYEDEIRRPYDVDFYLGLPPGLDARRVPVQPMVQPVTQTDARLLPPLLARVMTFTGSSRDMANDERSWRFGHPATSGTGSARGIARLFAAAVTGVEGAPAFLRADTVSVVGQQQVRGFDEVLSQSDRAHSIVFQKPTPALPFGGPRAFGHDGAQGALGGVDPDTGVAYAYTVARGPWPGGADPRALALAAELGVAFGG